MARKSRYESSAEKRASEDEVWRAALYVRLSREDGDKEESDSVVNQSSLLGDFAALAPDIEAEDIYVDDGWSGTTFERPAFKRMMQDIGERRVNCVIVKDLSRLGRNYIEVGQYIERVFPLANVRFISVTDGLDSHKSPQTMNNLIVPFKNIINDEYCRDISNKVRSSLDLKRRQGKFIGSFAPYGYQKDPDDRNHLVIDETAAETVRLIFDMYIGGRSILGITKRLNELGVPNPTAYKRLGGLNYKHPALAKNDGLWGDNSVRRILKNEVYLGALIQGKNRIKSYKLPVSEAVPEEQWYVVEGAHEPIVAREQFDKARSLMARDTRTAPKKHSVYVLAGFVKCADCGRAMNKKLISAPNRDYHYYICSTFKRMNSGACTKHSIRSDKLESAVLAVLKKQIEVAVSCDELLERADKVGAADGAAALMRASLASREDERRKLENARLELYPDWKNGDISKQEYRQLKSRLDADIAAVDAAIENIKKAAEAAAGGESPRNEFVEHFKKHRNIQSLTREIVVELIDNIYVHEGGEITVVFNFADAFERAVELAGAAEKERSE